MWRVEKSLARGALTIWDGARIVSRFVENERDASLIAAAPDLLSALRAVLMGYDRHDCLSAAPADCRVCGAGHAAIAKAEGR